MTYRKVYEIIGWVFEADIHCPECTYRRFPELQEDNNARIQDREGNEVRPIFLGDEHESPPYCGGCFQPLDI